MATPDEKLARLEAQREKLTTAERAWLDQVQAAWDEIPGRPISWREWNRVDALTAEAEARP